MNEPAADTGQIDEPALRRAIAHLTRWHFAGALIALVISFLPAFFIVHYLGRIDPLRGGVESMVDILPWVTTPGRVEVVLFVLGAILLLILTNIGTGIASDIVRWRIIERTNAQPEPIALAEAMKNRLRARSGRLEQQYRFFPKHEEDGKLAPNGLYVGIGTMAPFWLLLVFFFFYFRW